MSQVDDWSDGYTSDYLRDLNTYGPASANVPRSSVVSHQVRYRAPDTSDIPLAPGQNPEGSVYSNASGARMGQTKPASGYRAPAGGGWDVNSSDANLRFSNESGGKQYRVSRTQTAKKTVKKQAQPDKKQAQPDKKQAQNYGSYKDQSDPLSQHILANGSSGGAASAESVVSAAKNVTGQSAGRSDIDLSGLPRERSDMTPLPGDDWSPVDKAGAGINPFESDESLAAWKDLKLKSFPILPSEMAGGSPDEAVTRFRQIAADPNSTVADVLTAENEAKKAAVDEGMTMDNIAAFEKEVALNLLFAGAGSAVNALRGAGGAARAASSTGNAWAAGSRAAAGDATAGAKAFEEALSRMNGGAVRGAPVEGTARRSFSSAGSAENRSFGFDLSPEEVARAKSTHSAYVNGEAAGSAAPRAADYSKSSFDFNLSPAEAMSARTQHSAFTSNLAELRSALIRSGMPDREAAAYMQRAGFYNNPEALQQAVLTIRKHGPSGLFERSADEAAAAGIYNPKYGKSPLETWQQERAATEAANAKFRDMFGFSDVGKLAEAGNVGRGAAAAGGQASGWTSDLAQQLRAAGIPEDQIAASIARINAGAAGREAAAAGAGRAGEAAAGSRSFRFDLSPEEAARARASHEAFVRETAAGRGSAGRGSADNGAAADGGVSELANAGNAGRGKVALTEQTAKQGLGEVRAAVKSSNLTYEDTMQAVADFAAGKPGWYPAIDIAQSYAQLYRSGFGSMLSPRELKIAKAYEHATEGHMQGKFTDGMSQFIDGVLSGVPK